MTVSRSILVAALPLLDLLVGCAIDRFPTPGKELRSALGYYRQVEEMEASYFRARGHYGNLDAIFPFASGTGEFSIRQECQGGYCFEVTAANKTYVIRVVPPQGGRSASRAVALALRRSDTHDSRCLWQTSGRPAQSNTFSTANCELRAVIAAT